MMDEHERSYSDREFALILNRAAELGAATDSGPRRRTGLSLEEIKAIAVEAGFDPGLIERAARQLPTDPGISALERGIGGPLRHELSTHLDARLTEERAAHLLAMVRAAVGQQGEGDATAAGMSWSSKGEESQLFVTAHREADGTRVRVVVNRQGALAVTGIFSVTAGVIVPLVLASNLGFESLAANAAIFAGGLGASLAAARAFWSATTGRYRRRAGEMMDLLTRTLGQDPDPGSEDRRTPPRP